MKLSDKPYRDALVILAEVLSLGIWQHPKSDGGDRILAALTGVIVYLALVIAISSAIFMTAISISMFRAVFK